MPARCASCRKSRRSQNETRSKRPPDYHISVLMRFPSGLKRPISPSSSMTLCLLIDRRVRSKRQVAEEGAQGDSDHDPAVVCHENQPAIASRPVSVMPCCCVPEKRQQLYNRDRLVDSHQHKSIEGLHRVQNRLDHVRPLVHLRLVLPYRPRQRRSLSNDVASKVPR